MFVASFMVKNGTAVCACFDDNATDRNILKYPTEDDMIYRVSSDRPFSVLLTASGIYVFSTEVY